MRAVSQHKLMGPRQPYRTVSPALFDRTPKLQSVVDPFPCVVLGNGSLSGSKPMLSGAAGEKLATVLRYSTDFFASPRSLGKVALPSVRSRYLTKRFLLLATGIMSIPSVSVLDLFTYRANAKLWWVVHFNKLFGWPIFAVGRGMPD